MLPLTLGAATLQHHWTFDEGSGSVVADSVGNADMSIQGSNTGWTTGQVAGGYTFDGSSHAQTDVSDQVTNPSSGVAIAGWFKTSIGFQDRSYVFEIERAYGLRVRNSSLQLSFNGDVNGAPRWSDDVDDGLWHHFVAQNNGTTTELYVNGVLVGSRSESLASLSSESRDSAIGSRTSGAREFAGTFDDVRYYEGVLTVAEIETLAQISDLPPVAADDSYTDAVNQLLTVAAPGVLANDTENDGDAVTAVLVSNVAQGTLNLSSDGSFTYDPPTDFVGVVTFTYQAVDVDGVSNTATVSLSVLDPSSSLTPEEVAQIETDLGITLSAQEILDVSAIVKPQVIETWRNEANLRIESHRKADLTVKVVDSVGTSIPGADVHLELQNHNFKFGGVVTVMDLTDASNNLSDNEFAIADWERLVTSLFNSIGLNNGFKPRIANQHQYLDNFLTWASNNDLPTRGHLLIWPGTGDVEEMDTPGAVSGVDYGRHLTDATQTSTFATQDVLAAVETYKASSRTQVDKQALKAVVDAEIVEWASQWDVFEWDVINETLSNRLLMDILGYDQMAHWFHLAKDNMPNPNTKLFINEFQMPSARFTGTSYETRKATYFDRIDDLLTPPAPDPVLAGTQVLPAPVDGIGFQSRFRFLDGYDPAVVYSRIDEFATRYPSLELIGTEFEIKDDYHYLTGDLVQAYDENTRARVTEEVMTTYFSHDQITGLNAWDVMNPLPDGTDKAYTRSMIYYGDGVGGVDGPIVKLNALVWYYLHRIRYHTDVTDSTAANGEVTLRGFMGEYDITVSYEGNDYPANYTLLADGSIQVQLNDVTVTPAAPTEVTIEHWPFDDVVDTPLTDTLNVTGTTQFFGSSSTIATDGAGLLVISQDTTKASGGNFLGSSEITIGARSTGKYELELIIDSVALTGGDANGSNFGLGFKDSAAGGDLFRIRLNKTTGGLAVNTFFASTYTGFHTFTGVFSLTEPLKLRVVIDLDSDLADIYMTEGAGTETSLGQIATVSGGVWDQLSFSAVNNTTDWGANDMIAVDSIKIRKLELDNYDLWEARTVWMGETLTEEADDPDGDKLINLLEYALGGNPLIDDANTVLPTLVEFEGAPHYQFTLGVDTPDLNLSIEHSVDLNDWDTLTPTVIHGEAGQLIQIPLLAPGLDRRFSRLSVSEN